MPKVISPDIRAFKRHLESMRSASSHTVRSYLTDLAHFEGHLKKKGLALTALTLADHRNYHSSISETLAESSRARRVATLKSFYAFLQKTGRIEASPARRLKAPKVPRRLPKVIPIDEVF